MSKFYVGIDIGTTSIKLTAVDQKMKALADLQYNYHYLTPKENFNEIEPDVWLKIVMKGLKKLFQQFSPGSIAGIGITGQMHTTIFVDQNKQAIRPAILWNDTRTQEMIPKIKKRLQQTSRSAPIAKIVSTGSPLANLLWLKEKEFESYRKIHKVLIAKDYLVLKLTGTYSTDYCDASTSSFFDLYQDQWSQEVMQIFDLPEEIFPVIHYSSKKVGILTEEIQRELGINAGIPVVAGTGDNVASALVSGCFSNHQPLISLGTSGVVAVPNEGHHLKETGKNVVTKIQVSDNSILTQGTVQAGAKVNSWWTENILHTDDFFGEQGKIPSSLIGKNNVLFFPHLNGEKTLYASPQLRGAFVGLSLDTTREAMYLAVLEGLAFGIRRLYEAMKNKEKPTYFSIVGGGAQSNLWIQLFANILQALIKRINTSQEAVHGAALLAIFGVNGSSDIEHSDYQIIQPQTQLISAYDEKYKNYLRLADLIFDYTENLNV